MAGLRRHVTAVTALALGIASCLLSLAFLLTAPVAAGVALAWSVAVVLHLLAKRRAPGPRIAQGAGDIDD